MKTMIVIIGILTILAGVLPFLDGFGILPAIVPTSGPVYSGIIILIGVIGLLYANKKFGLLASQKLIVSVLALLIILIGIIAVIYGKKQF